MSEPKSHTPDAPKSDDPPADSHDPEPQPVMYEDLAALEREFEDAEVELRSCPSLPFPFQVPLAGS